MGGGGKTVESNSTSSQQSQGTWAPHAAAAPGYGFYAGNLQNLMQTPTPFFPGQTYVGPSAATQQGVNSIMDMAQNYMPQVLGQMGQNYSFLSNAADVANNPHVQAMHAMTQRRMNENLNENILPGIQQGGIGVNALGSSRQGYEAGRARGDTQKAIADARTQLDYGAYDRGLGAQQYALGQTGNVMNNLKMPGETMAKAGQLVEGYQGKALQDAMMRFAHQYQEPWQRMQNLGSGLGILQPMGTTHGSSFGQSQSTQPNPGYMSPLQTALGIGTTIAGLGMPGGGTVGGAAIGKIFG